MNLYHIRFTIWVLLFGIASVSVSQGSNIIRVRDNASAVQDKKFNEKSSGSGSPIYHKVKKGETVFSIAKKYKVSTAEIKKWNRLKGNNIQAKQKLIVGYSNNKTMVDKAAQKKIKQPAAVKTTPETKKSVPALSQRQVKQEKKKEENIESETVAMKEISEDGIASWIDDEDINTGKYYALHRTVHVGTIIKVTNGANQKSVYVKVLGKIPARDELDVIIIQISKGAADKLEVREAHFNAVLNYSLPE